MANQDDERTPTQKAIDEAFAGLEASSPLGQVAAAYHEAFIEFQKAGFSGGTAAYLVSAMFNGNPGFAPGPAGQQDN